MSAPGRCQTDAADTATGPPTVFAASTIDRFTF